jgi:large subunit ribosomal protein L18
MYSKQQRKKRRAMRSHYRKNCMSDFRLLVHRSNCHFYVQLIDDKSAHTIYSTSTLSKELKSEKRTLNSNVVLKLAQHFVNNIPDNYKGAKIVFDSGGYAYHGLVKLFADKARECLKF